MDSTTKTLREYQEKLVYDVCRTSDDVREMFSAMSRSHRPTDLV